MDSKRGVISRCLGQCSVADLVNTVIKLWTP